MKIMYYYNNNLNKIDISIYKIIEKQEHTVSYLV